MLAFYYGKVNMILFFGSKKKEKQPQTLVKTKGLGLCFLDGSVD
jgi:hypothetical protein